ncbi:hypothetical protein WA158_000897 [Blastocystis sp. Blastoise]
MRNRVYLDRVYYVCSKTFGCYINQLGELNYNHLLKGLSHASKASKELEIKGRPISTGDIYFLCYILRASQLATASYGHLLVKGLLGEGGFFDRIVSVMTLGDQKRYIDALLLHLQIQRTDLLYYTFGKDEIPYDEDLTFYTPAYFLIRDPQQHRIVLTIRGTFCIQDFITDFSGSNYSWNQGYVHMGMGITANYLLQNTSLPSILRNSLLDNPGYSFEIVGHSMGASIAALLTMELEKDPFYEEHQISCVCLAPAPVLSKSLLEQSKTNIISIVNADDIVPRLSKEALDQFADTVMREASSCKLHYQSVSSRSLEGYVCDDFYLPGTVYYMNPYLDNYNLTPKLDKALFNVPALDASHLLPSISSSQGMIELQPEEFPETIIISPFLLFCHFPTEYEKLITNITKKMAKLIS